MNSWVIDASLSLGWFLEDEQDREYSLDVLYGLEDHHFVVPFLWHYEVCNGLLGARRRKRITSPQVLEFLDNLRLVRVQVDRLSEEAVLKLPKLALEHDLSIYDTACLELTLRLKVPIATHDKALKQAVMKCGGALVDPGKR